MNYKLLVAVSESGERNHLCRILSDHLGSSAIILKAGTGREALSIFSAERPQIAVLDIAMQDISGLTVAEKIRENCKTCALLFLSETDNFDYARQAIALRALDFLVKPYDEKKLLLSVEEAAQYAAHFAIAETHLTRSRSAGVTYEDESARLSLVREDIAAYIETHYTEELSMKNAAQAMNYSDAYFCKLFKQCFHVNFSTYLNEYRIAKAKAMMENPRINIKDISIACGYTDSNYFARVFKRITGQTPSEYRLIIMERALK